MRRLRLLRYDFPPAHRTKLHFTNGLERLNGEVEPRTNVVGIFPNEKAVYRLVAVLLRAEAGKDAMTLGEAGAARSGARCTDVFRLAASLRR